MRSKQFLIISYPYSVEGKVEFRHLQLVVQDVAELFSIISSLQNQPVSVSILTTKGDLLTNDGSEDIRFPVGTDGRILMADSGEPSGLLWQDPSSIIPSAVWGAITGVLSAQTDLQLALSSKEDLLGFTPEDIANKNQLSGYAGLDSSGKLSGSQQKYGSTADTACEGNDSRLSNARTPTSHASTHTNGTDDIQTASSIQKGLLSSADWSTFNSKQSALGFTPLNPSNNLSDVSNSVTARENLGIQLNTTTSDYTNNTSSLSNVTGASFSVVSGGVYYFEFSGNMESGSSSGLRLGISVPSSSTVVYELWGNNSASNNFQSRSESYSGGEIVRTICAVATTRLGFRIFGTITAGANGTVSLQGKIAGSSYTITLYSGLRTFAIKK